MSVSAEQASRRSTLAVSHKHYLYISNTLATHTGRQPSRTPLAVGAPSLSRTSTT